MFGQKVLESLHSFEGGHNAAMLVRHGERHPFAPGVTDPTLALLTEKGKQMARDMGAALRGFSHVRFFHSPVTRCKQTAEGLAAGAASQGLHTEIIGEHPCLGFGYTRDMAKAISMYEALDEGFMGEWFSARIPDSVIAPPEHVAQEINQHLFSRLLEQTSHGRRLDVHVSHDWNILVMRELLLGVTHEKAGWLTYLDGLTFTGGGSQAMTAAYHTDKVTKPLPWSQFVLRPRQA